MSSIDPDFLQSVRETIKDNPRIDRTTLESLVPESQNTDTDHKSLVEESVLHLLHNNEVALGLNGRGVCLFPLAPSHQKIDPTPALSPVNLEAYENKLKFHRLMVQQGEEELQQMKSDLKKNGFSFSDIKEIENKVFIELSRRYDEN